MLGDSHSCNAGQSLAIHKIIGNSQLQNMTSDTHIMTGNCPRIGQLHYGWRQLITAKPYNNWIHSIIAHLQVTLRKWPQANDYPFTEYH